MVVGGGVSVGFGWCWWVVVSEGADGERRWLSAMIWDSCRNWERGHGIKRNEREGGGEKESERERERCKWYNFIKLIINLI